MTLRVLILLFFLFVLVAGVARLLPVSLHHPLSDTLLLFLLVMFPVVLAIFWHYRLIGRLRTRGLYKRALRHLRFWRILLPWEAYQQLRVQIIIESGEEKAAQQAIEQASAAGLDAAFLGGFRGDLYRRLGRYNDADHALEQALDSTPPGLLRAGLLAQQARLYIHHRPRKLPRVPHLLDEATALVRDPPHTTLLQAIRGEYEGRSKRYTQAARLLSESLDSLLRTNQQQEQPATFGARLASYGRRFLDWLTYTGQDEHQYPFYAELLLSLGRAYEALHQHEKARTAWTKGLDLCQQSFVAQPLREALS